MRNKLDRLHIRRVDLDGCRLFDEVHSDHKAIGLVLAQQNPPDSFERAADHLHRHAFLEVGVRIVGKPADHERLERLDLVLRDRLWAAIPHDLHDPRRLQHRQPLLPGELREAVARKQGRLDLLLPVLPLAQPHDGGQEGLDPLAGEAVPDLFFMAGASAKGVPAKRSERRMVYWVCEVCTVGGLGLDAHGMVYWVCSVCLVCSVLGERRYLIRPEISFDVWPAWEYKFLNFSSET